jgi:hypothetical protein
MQHVHDRQSNNGPQQLVHIFRCSQHVRNHDQQHWKQCCLFYVCTVCALTERCSGVYECSCQTYKTQYALTVAVIQSSSRDTIFSKKARARPSLTSSNIPVVLTSKCLQQHINCEEAAVTRRQRAVHSAAVNGKGACWQHSSTECCLQKQWLQPVSFAYKAMLHTEDPVHSIYTARVCAV